MKKHQTLLCHVYQKRSRFEPVPPSVHYLLQRPWREGVHYACIACITIDSVMRMKKMNYPQVYLEECKYKIKKIKMSKFINTELESESELESDTELDSKSELESDSE